MTASLSAARGFLPWIMAAACLAAGMALAPVQNRIDARLESRPPAPDLLYFNSPGMVKRMALGYESLAADLYWMRAIQYYGRREEAARRPVRYKNLYTLLDIATTLDPDMLDAYRAGSGFLAEPEPLGAGQPEEALRLLDKGIARNPAEWRLQFDKGMIYFWYLKDFARAGRIWEDVAALPDVPHWMGSLAAMAVTRSGAVDTARALWQRQYQQSNRADVRENALNHLASFQVNEDLWALEFFIGKFRARHGRLPSHLGELVNSGFLRAVPLDPKGTPYHYDRASGAVSLSPESRVRYLKVPFDYKDEFMAKLARPGFAQ